MSIRPFHFRVGRGDEGARLDLVVQRWLQEALGRPLSKAAVRRLIIAGVVRVEGRPSRRAGMELRAGARLDARLDSVRLPAPRDSRVVQPEAVRILYEDDGILAVAKPPGLQVHASADPARPDLYTIVRRQLAARGDAGESSDGLPYLGLHHRLDKDTSGVVLFTRRPSLNAAVAGQFENRSVEKVYHALSTPGNGSVEDRWRVENRLAPAGQGRAARTASTGSGGRYAATVFAVLARMPAGLLVEARPETGRKHQIRAHLSESGVPILGDVRYGGPERAGGVPVPRVMLHAWRMVLTHPSSGRRLEIGCEYPGDFEALRTHLARRG